MRVNKKNNRGVTLIALVVTIIVLFILAGISLSTLTGENGIIKNAQKAEKTTKLSGYQEQVKLYIQNKQIENSNFNKQSLMAGKDYLNYNTKNETEKGNIKTIIPTITNEYLEKLEIVKGELLINTKNKTEIEIAQTVGIEVNPYDITEDGELQSSNGNLLLVDSTGTLTIPDSVTKIGEGAFANLEGLKTIIIPGSVREIAKNAFTNNKTLEKVIIKEGLEKIGEIAFGDCTNLKTVEMPNSIIEIEKNAFRGCIELQKINIPNKLKNIRPYTFYECKKLSNIVIPNSVEKIWQFAFFKTDIEEINIPKNTKEIMSSSFSLCTKLKNINVEEGNENFQFENGILFNKTKEDMIIILESAIDGTTFKIPKTVTSLKEGQISSFENITSIEIPASVKTIETGFFIGNPNINNVIIEEENTNYSVKDGAIYNKDQTILLIYFAKTPKVELAEGVIELRENAFRLNTELSEIKLPESLIKIGGLAFSLVNSKLLELNLGKRIKELDPLFAYGLHNIKITIDKYNENYCIENNMIFNKEKTILHSIIGNEEQYKIPEGVTEISDNAFHNKNLMKNVIIPETVSKIGKSFNYCNSLTKIEIPNSVKEIDTGCFSAATNLKEIIIHKSPNSILGSPWGCIYGEKAIKWKKQ